MKQDNATLIVENRTIDWDDFAEALKNQFGESLIEEKNGEDDPFNWWLTDVTVKDIVDFIRYYR